MTARVAALLAGCSFAVAVATIPILRRVAARRRLVDDAGGDPLKIHAAPVPFVGGVGILAGCAVALAAAAAAEPTLMPAVALVLGVGVGVAALGFADDVANVRPAIRFAVEAGAGVALAVGGAALGVFDGGLGVAFLLFTIFYVVGAINAVNMQDGLDGLAGGVVLVSCVGFAVAGAARGDAFAVAVAAALGGAIAGFLVYNFNPASVFMGDNGSYFLGALVAAMALSATAANPAPRGIAGGVLVVGAPVFDAAFAIVRRLARGVSPFAGDRSHFYDLLAQRGLSTRAVALLCYAVQAVLVAAGVALLVS